MEKKHQVIIDSDKCVGCGLCQKDCVGCDIRIENGKAVANGASCIMCGHCEAICPQGAVKITGFDDEITEFDEQVRLDPKQLMDAIKTRRTIRQFTDEKVSDEILDMIFEAGRMAPTGTNAQGTSYVLLDSKKEECEEAAVKMLKKCHVYKSYKFSIHGWMEYHTAIFQTEKNAIVSNFSGFGVKKTMEKVFFGEKKTGLKKLFAKLK